MNTPPSHSTHLFKYLAGHSMYKIAPSLIADNVATLMGGKWAQGTIANILRHPALRGSATIKGITLQNYYPPVITQPQWEQLQAKLRDNTARKGGAGVTDIVANLFRNRCRCSHCGETITTARSASHRLYVCKGKRVGKCESKYSLRVADVERDFFLNYLQQSPTTILQKNTAEYSNKVSAVQSQLARLDAEILKVTELTDTLPLEELKTKLTRLETQRQQLKADLDKLNTSNISSQNAPKALADIKATFLKNVRGAELTKLLTHAFEWNLIEKHLKDNETRKRLLALLPSIVKGLEIDTTHKRYRVITHNGQSEWRKV